MRTTATTHTAFTALSKYHPIVIEGMGAYDPRDPSMVANHIHSQLKRHWSINNKNHNHDKPKLVVIQGDPLSENGISAITPRVAKLLGDDVPRALVCLDLEMAPYHAPNADRENVVMEFKYSDMTSFLDNHDETLLPRLEATIDRYLQEKNERRTALGKPQLKDYFRQFALLQEVTKATCRRVCGGDITVAHTARDISEFSVTSFYEAGLDLGLVSEQDMVSYSLEDQLDFEKIDKR
jgi:hypothetical protein